MTGSALTWWGSRKVVGGEVVTRVVVRGAGVVVVRTPRRPTR